MYIIIDQLLSSYFQSCEISSIDEVITMLRQNLIDKCFTMVISRTNVLEEFFWRTDKKSFDPSKKLRVSMFFDFIDFPLHPCRWSLLVKMGLIQVV